MQEIEVNHQSINLEVIELVNSIEAFQSAPSEINVESRGYQSPVTKIQQYAYQITQLDITEKKVYITGEFAPQGGFVKFQPRGAPCVIITLDFIFNETDNSISWDGLGLDGILEEGDWVEVSYSYFYH